MLVPAAALWLLAQGAAAQAVDTPAAPAPPPATAEVPGRVPAATTSPASRPPEAGPADARPTVEPLPPPSPPPLTVAVEAQTTLTDNATQSAQDRRADLILMLRPSLAYRRKSTNLDVDFEGAVGLRGFARDSQSSRTVPEARARVRANVIDGWMSIDAAAFVRPIQTDLFATPLVDDATTPTRNQRALRFSPIVERAFDERHGLAMRHDATVSTHPTIGGARFNANESLVRVERSPRRLGGNVEWSRRVSDTDGEASSRVELERWQAHAMVEAVNDWTFGAFAGRERTRLLLDDRSDNVYGLSLRATPTPRTEFDLRLEQRFFGRAGALNLRHRMPFASIVLSVSREPVTSLASLGVLGQGTDLRARLDDMLATRVPQADERRAQVDAILSERGLAPRLAQPVEWFAAYPQLSSAAAVTWVVQGRRNTTAISAYRRTLVALAYEGASLALPASNDSRTQGVSWRWDRRLTPQLNGSFALAWSKVEGLGQRTGDTSQATSSTLSLVQRLAPRSDATFGVQHLRVDPSGAGLTSYHTTALFVGWRHRL